MAQGDLFRQFADLGGILDKATAAGVINTQKRLELLADVYTAELNINDARKKMLQSDTKSLNIFKKLASVANNISDAMKENWEACECVIYAKYDGGRDALVAKAKAIEK